MNPLTVNETDWAELLGTRPSYVSITPTDPDNSDNSTADTIKLMQQYAVEDSQSEQVVNAASEIRDLALDDSDEESLIEATFEWVKEHVTFQPDEDILRKLFGIDRGVELLIKPSRLLSMNNPMGDCDDFSMLTSSILLNLGIKSNYTTVAANQNHPGVWSHVYNMAQLSDGSLMPVDSSHGQRAGEEVATQISRKQVWGGNNSIIEGGEIKSMFGIGDVDWESILTPLSNVGGAILKAQYGQPQLAPGTYIRGADGSILTNQPVTTAGYLPAAGSSFGGGMSGLLIPAVLVIGAIALLGRK